MKRVTHPQLTQSLIQRRDGSLYAKWWLYYKNILQVEIEPESHFVWKKVFENIRSTKRLKDKKNANN